MSRVRLSRATLATLVVAACDVDRVEAPGQTEARIRFTDVTAEQGLAGFVHVGGHPEKLRIIESFGAGVALFDYDGDGDLDAYLTNGSAVESASDARPSDALFAHEGGRFVDRTIEAGIDARDWTYGVRAGDYDGDGWTDLYTTNLGPNVLRRNRGDGTFADVTEASGVGDAGCSTGASYVDHDRDGDLDLYVANYIRFDPEVDLARRAETFRGLSVFYGPRGLQGARDTLYENRGDGSFRDVSDAAGIGSVASFGFQPVVFDADLDGWCDVYVTNDSEPNLLWVNLRDGTFVDDALARGLAFSMEGGAQAGMGIAVGDFDGDREPDLFVTNFAEDYFTLYQGEGGGFFRDATSEMGLRHATRPLLGWGTEFVDFDDDGDEDLFAVNGHVYPQVDRLELGTRYRQRPLFLENAGGRLVHRADVLAFERAARGAAVGDVDGDGDQDLLIGNLDAPPTLLRNDSASGGRWLKVRLVGADENRDAVGARVVARIGTHRVLRLVGTGSGFLSSSDPRIHFGLGDAERIDELEVTWPRGTVERVGPFDAGTIVTIAEGRGVVGAKGRPR